MKRETVEQTIFNILEEEFEIVDPNPDVNLGEEYEFDSIDALEMLTQVEENLGIHMTMDEKKQLFEYRTINKIIDYLFAVCQAQGA